MSDGDVDVTFPQSWREAEIGDVCDLVMGQAPPGDSYNTLGQGLPLIAGAGDFGEVQPEAKKYTTAATKNCDEGDIVLGIRASIGTKVLADRKYCLGRGVAGLRPRDSRVLDSRFLWHWLSSAASQLAAKGKGATFKQVNRRDIAELLIPLPPLAEQRRIASILDQADALRAKRRHTLNLLDTLTQSIFTDMFGDRQEILDAWPVEPLGSHLAFLTSGSRGWAKYYASSGCKFIRIQNVGGGLLDLDDLAFVDHPESAEATRTAVQAGDVLLSITADLGRTAVVPTALGRAHINQHLALLRPEGIGSVYLAHLLESSMGREYFKSRNRNGVKAGLNFDDIRTMPVPKAPASMQHEFEKAIEHAQRNAGLLNESRAEVDVLIAALQHRAFRGEL